LLFSPRLSSGLREGMITEPAIPHYDPLAHIEEELTEETRKIFDRNAWKPNRKQEQFLRLPVTIKEGLYGGGAGSGKSDVLMLYGIVHRWHENPRFKQVFLRRTFPELKNEIIPRSRDIYPKFGATYNASDKVWTFPRPDQYGSGESNSGAMIFFGHCENEDDVHKYDSMEISLFTPDEITSLTEFIYLYIAFERNRAPKNSGLPSITRAAGMPGGIGHTFVKKRFVDPAPEGGKILIGKGGNKRVYIHSTLEDNKDNVDPTYAQSLDGRPEAERKAKKFGDWSAYLGQVFEEFRDRKYPDEPANALHVVSPFEIPAWWPRLVVGDWGYRAMTWIGYAAISPQRRIYIYREQTFVKTRIEEWAPEVRTHIDKESPRVVKFCQSAGQDRGQEHTIQQQIESAINRPIQLTSNSPGSRVAGKTLLHEYLRWKPKPKIPIEDQQPYDHEYALWLWRNKGEHVYRSYLASYDPQVEETNLPKLQIFKCEESNSEHYGHPNCCHVLIETIKACTYDKPKNNKPAEDVAEFEGDDPYDGIRYLVDAAERYFEEAQDEFKKVQAQEAQIERLQSGQDWTAFYRNMKSIESKGKLEAIPRYRKHR
jgi:hypothetical protein